MDRITDAFIWPTRDPEWLMKVLIMALILLIPIVGAINAIGWMLACIDRLRAGETRLAPANFSYLARGLRLFVVNLVYGLAITLIALAIYIPALLMASNQSNGSANPTLISLAIVLSLLAFSVATLGSLALNFAMPSIVLATDAGGMIGGLRVGDVVRRARANLSNTLIAGLMLIAAGFVGSLGIVACGIGIFFTTVYALAIQAWVVRSFEVGSPATKVE
ncbi:MAG TPA: DUF4013 domain-containing protein [Candidatus Dormibacteraeota bacterium]|nr:DUF4013 domain-containing protein [Candidatus Dormibacteraeota bacterium]